MDLLEKPVEMFCVVWTSYGRPYISSPFVSREKAQKHIDQNIRPTDQDKQHYKGVQILPVNFPFTRLEMSDSFTPDYLKR